MAPRAGVPALDGGGRERCDRRTKRPQIDAPGRAAHHVCRGTSCRRHVPRESREIGGTWEGKDRKKEKKEKKEKKKRREIEPPAAAAVAEAGDSSGKVTGSSSKRRRKA